MTTEGDFERPKTSRGRREDGVPSARMDSRGNWSQYTQDRPERDDTAYTPRPRSSRQRPKSGYRVRRPQAEMHGENYHLYERTAQYTDGITAQASAKLHSESPRSSYDSGVYEHQPTDHFPPTQSPRPASRQTSARPRTKHGQRTRASSDTPDPNWRPTSSRPGSASSFSRYKVLPDIGVPSTTNTTEPQFPTQSRDNLHRDSPGSSYQKDSQAMQREFIRENSLVGRTYKDIHHSMDQRMKELSVANATAQETHDPETESDIKSFVDESAIIHIPTEKGGGVNQKDTNSGNPQKSNTGDTTVIDYPPLQRKVVLPPEPHEGEDRLLLAVKLPNGQRVQRHFRTSDQMLHVLRFAESSSQLDFSNCEVVCDVPRKVFKDLTKKLSSSGLENRTVLHIQIPDD